MPARTTDRQLHLAATEDPSPETGAGELLERALRDGPHWGEMGAGACWEIPNPLASIPVPEEDRDGPPTALAVVIAVAAVVALVLLAPLMSGEPLRSLLRHIWSAQ